VFSFFTFVLSLFHLYTIDTTFYILFLPYFYIRVFFFSFSFISSLFLYFVHSLSFSLSFIFSSCFSSFVFFINICFFLVPSFLCSLSLVFQESVILIQLMLQTSHLPVKLSVANWIPNITIPFLLLNRHAYLLCLRLRHYNPVTSTFCVLTSDITSANIYNYSLPCTKLIILILVMDLKTYLQQLPLSNQCHPFWSGNAGKRDGNQL